jgi:hypothetical protein
VAPGQSSAEKATPLQATSCSREKPKLLLRFPPHLSLLRTAYEQEQKTSSTAGQAKLSTPMLGLGASLDEPSLPRAVEANTSKKSVVAHDLVLSNLVRTLLAPSVQYVGIAATDVADVIFLAHHLRSVVVTPSREMSCIATPSSCFCSADPSTPTPPAR